MRLHSAFIGQPPARILVTGGASKNAGILRVLADVFQAEIVPLRVSNSSALGGALRAAQAVEGRPWAELYGRFAAPALDRRVAPDEGSKVTYQGLSTQLQERLKDLLAQTTPTR
jgi:sugar (pentulose or hexulose) kinase